MLGYVVSVCLERTSYRHFTMLHPQGSDERSIRLYNNVVLLAIASDILSGVKWMDFDLIDRRRDARVGIQ
jgi:hypothetical protein